MGRARRYLRRTLAAIGVVVALVAVDVAVGLAWDRLDAPKHDGPIAQVSDSIGGSSAPFHDDRADTPAMAKVAWRNDYFAEMRRIRYEYWPFVLNRPKPFHGDYFTMDGWSRRTWQPADLGGDAPVVWFLGGSALWGEGQRDLHTIPSEVARLAAADGLPIRALNYGQSGWVLHQERILLEQLLDDPATTAPDLVTFYDGANEVSVQAELPADLQRDPLSPAASHFGVDNARAVLGDAAAAAAPSPTSATEPEADVASDLLRAYQRRSFLLRGVRALRRAIEGDPASAAAAEAPAQEAGDASAAERAEVVYVEDRAQAQAAVADAGATSLFFWQPEGLEVPGYRAAAASVGAPTIDLTGVLSGKERDVFMDLVHTNETGAKIVAAEVYASMKPAIEAWYRAHR